jgi:hypothetical protein
MIIREDNGFRPRLDSPDFVSEASVCQEDETILRWVLGID